MAGGAEVPAFMGEGQEVFAPALLAPDPAESPGEIPTTQELLDERAVMSRLTAPLISLRCSLRLTRLP